ncbi:FAD-dependent oxidoreductase [Rouxiella sp. S1S-2]|uniref:FAD/NAD(P)-binding protein n=1 Tax=Rouxiella sp. S1S-2 TaxID=2653856 RepID=UPI00126475D7|nr:FAD-dependent oxidoreductase [Rouxiella sp. S1S-2]KAB7897213.1 FAD-dependent oxidoreductase [Rouxiella sp. S1S-2]
MVDRHIVIVGGGFSGTALAIQLARRGSAGLRVTVIEPRDQLGRGVAYGTRDSAHRINVPAERMHLSADEEGDFDRWFRASPAYEKDADARWLDGKVYPQRQDFGTYIGERYAQTAASSTVELNHIRDYAVGFDDGCVITASGKRYQADDIVLAISHPPPALPSVLKTLKNTPALIANPWQADALSAVAPDDRVAIIGSGLTMSDAVASLHRQGHRGPITAFSRRGQLPRPNLSGQFEPRALDYSQPQRATARGWLRRIRDEVAQAAEQSLPWQLVLDDIRVNGQRLWQQFSLKEQRRFLRHLRPWWDVHRYRIAPQVSAVLQQLQEEQRLQVRAARLAGAAAVGKELQLTLHPRGAEPEPLTVDKIIVTTGPAHGSLLTGDALLSQLAAQGLIQADPLALGIWVNQQSQTLNGSGEANPHLLVVGPAARGRFGELMGLPQVAEHAEKLAHQLLNVAVPSLKGRCPASLKNV